MLFFLIIGISETQKEQDCALQKSKNNISKKTEKIAKCNEPRFLGGWCYGSQTGLADLYIKQRSKEGELKYQAWQFCNGFHLGYINSKYSKTLLGSLVEINFNHGNTLESNIKHAKELRAGINTKAVVRVLRDAISIYKVGCDIGVSLQSYWVENHREDTKKCLVNPMVRVVFAVTPSSKLMGTVFIGKVFPFFKQDSKNEVQRIKFGEFCFGMGLTRSFASAKQFSV